MTKLVPAELTGGVVKIDGQPVPDALKTGLGTANSEGVALLDGDRVVYIVMNGQDLKTLIAKVADIVQRVSTIVQAHDTAPTAVGTQAAAIAQLNVKRAELEAMGDALQ